MLSTVAALPRRMVCRVSLRTRTHHQSLPSTGLYNSPFYHTFYFCKCVLFCAALQTILSALSPFQALKDHTTVSFCSFSSFICSCIFSNKNNPPFCISNTTNVYFSSESLYFVTKVYPPLSHPHGLAPHSDCEQRTDRKKNPHGLSGQSH